MADTDDSSSGSASEGALDEETEALCLAAPLCSRVSEALHDSFGSSLPPEVELLMSAHGARVSSSKLLETNQHSTFLLLLDPALQWDGEQFSKVIVRVLGAELGDTAIAGRMDALLEVKARKLAALAGVCVPRIFVTSHCSSVLGPLEFMVEEFVDGQAGENAPPAEEFDRVVDAVQSKLLRQVLADIDVTPLPHFSSIITYMQWLMTSLPLWDIRLISAVDKFAKEIVSAPPEPDVPPVLMHQNLSDENVICSRVASGTERRWTHDMGVWSASDWALEAVIGWDSAAVCDPRWLSAAEPWATARIFSLVAKGAWLAERFVRGTLPRCELMTLIECYDEAAWDLDGKGLLRHATWASRVESARAAMLAESAQNLRFGPAVRSTVA